MENNYWKNTMKEQTDALNKGINNYQNEISNMDSLSKNVKTTNPTSDYRDFKEAMNSFLNEMSELEKDMTNYQKVMKENYDDVSNLNASRK